MGPLEGVKVYVDVRSRDGKANYSICVREQLQLLGAEICKSLNSQCSHVVFKDGKMNTRLHANKLGVTLVNVLWVEKCREANSRCDESEFPLTEDRVETPVLLRKTRPRYRSLQPATGLEKPKKKPGNKEQGPRRRSSRVSGAGERSPVRERKKSKDKTKSRKKLQWPPDHSDVCSEAEIAVHMEIGKELKTKGKRKLKKDVFLDTSINSSQQKKSASATDNFVIKKTPASKQTLPNEEDDSQMSLYDASQHFERKEYSITNIINKLDTTIDKVSDSSDSDLSSSDDDLMLNAVKRTCLLTNSQKNVMDKTFEFDEVDKDEKPDKPKRNRKRSTKQLESKGQPKQDSGSNLKDTPTVLQSPTKLLTFNSNYNENSDIITDLDAVASGTEEHLALRQIKSPVIVRSKSRRRTASAKTSITIKISNNNVYSTVPSKSSLDIELSKDTHQDIVQENLKIIHKEGYDEMEVNEFETERDHEEDLILNDEVQIMSKNNAEVINLFVENSEPTVEEETVRCPLKPQTKIIEAPHKPNTATVFNEKPQNKMNSSDQNTLIKENFANETVAKKTVAKKTVTKEIVAEETVAKEVVAKETVAKETVAKKTAAITNKLLQEPEITSTSETKENDNANAQSRRVSKRLRHSSAKLRNPDFVCDAPHSILGLHEKVAINAKKLDDKKQVSRRSSRAVIDVVSEEESFNLKVKDPENCVTRKSDRKRRTTPKYAVLKSNSEQEKSETNKSGTGSRKSNDAAPTEGERCAESHSDKKPGMIRAASKRSNRSSVVSEDTATEESDVSQSSITKTRKRPKKTLDTSSESLANCSQRRSLKKDNSLVICTTCCHRDDQAMVRNTAKMLSGAITETVSLETSHVVMGTAKRTINLLKAIVHGAHVLSLDWVTDSISNNEWLTESKYSLSTDFPILKMKGEMRRAKAADLFTDAGLIFIEAGTAPPHRDLTTLVQLCGGKVTKSRTRSRYCIGGVAHDREHVSLSEQWILDSISKLKIQDSSKYLLFPFRSPSPEF